MAKISVIIPIYNTERYVEKCIRSVMAQTLHDIEIICVDDFSPDGSAEIVQRLALEDSRIRLIRHQRNLGLGGARNTGIEASTSPYVTGVDSDDYILPEMMQRLWELSEEQVADVVSCGLSLLDQDGELIQVVERPVGNYRNDQDQINILDLLTPSFCAKIWRTTLFTSHDIAFPEHLYYEDLATTPRLLRHAIDIRVIRDPLYCYVSRGDSITNTSSARHIVDYFRVYDILFEFLRSEGLLARYREELIEKIGKSLRYHTLNVTESDMGQDDKLQYLRYMLMLKLGYLELSDRLQGLEIESLQALLLGATTCDDLPGIARE